MVVTPIRLPRAMRRELDRLVARPGSKYPDRSALARQLLADGIRRANASSPRLGPQTDDQQPPADPPPA